MSDPILLQRNNDVVTLTFNDPDRRNAMTRGMGEALAAHSAALAQDTSIRALILTGAGKAFSAGGDLDMLDELASFAQREPVTGRRQVRDTMRSFYKLFLSLRDLPFPTISAINGAAIGAGLCVALGCDLRYAARGAKLGVNFARVGIHPGMAATWTLPRLVGPALAAELLFSSRVISADEAQTIGLINRAVDGDELYSAVEALAEEISGGAPGAIRGLKQALRQSASSSIEDQLSLEAEEQALCFETDDVREGLAAARERRPPRFTGR